MEWLPIIVISLVTLILLIVAAGWFGQLLLEALEAFVEEDDGAS